MQMVDERLTKPNVADFANAKMTLCFQERMGTAATVRHDYNRTCILSFGFALNLSYTEY